VEYDLCPLPTELFDKLLAPETAEYQPRFLAVPNHHGWRPFAFLPTIGEVVNSLDNRCRGGVGERAAEYIQRVIGAGSLTSLGFSKGSAAGSRAPHHEFALPRMFPRISFGIPSSVIFIVHLARERSS
jgi:hypothetical protein